MEGFDYTEILSNYYDTQQIHRLQRLTVGVGGAGGLGSNCIHLLVRSGFSRFIVADFDKVSVSNLNRQSYTCYDIGREKVHCLEKQCRTINPNLKFTTHYTKVDESNVHSLFDECDIIIEAFDNAESKALLFETYLHSSKMLIGASGIAGIGKTETLKIRTLRDNCFIIGDEKSGVSATLLPFGPRVMTAAAMMADKVLEWAITSGK